MDLTYLVAFLFKLIVTIAICAVLCICVKWWVDYMEWPQPLRLVAFLLVGIICFAAVLNAFGVVGAPVLLRLR